MDGGGGGTRLVTRVEGIVCGRVNGPFLSEGNFFFFSPFGTMDVDDPVDTSRHDRLNLKERTIVVM